MTRRTTLTVETLVAVCPIGAAGASGQSAGRTSHMYWPKIDGVSKKAKQGNVTYVGARRSDELLGHHGSDVLRGGDASDYRPESVRGGPLKPLS